MNFLTKPQFSPDVLLIMPPPWGIDAPPLGIATLVAALEQTNIAVDVLDLNIKLYNHVDPAFRHLWAMNYAHLWRYKNTFLDIHKLLMPFLPEYIEFITEHPASLIGFSLPSNCPDLFLSGLLQIIKERVPQKRIVVGGVSVSVREQRLDFFSKLDHPSLVDYYVIGEGEQALIDLVSFLKDPSALKRLSARILCGTEPDRRLPPLPVNDFSTAPTPVLRKFSFQEYQNPESALIEFSRGCIGHCLFCCHIDDNSFRIKAAETIFKNMREYKACYNIKHFSITDSAFNGDITVLEGLCDLLSTEPLGVSLSGLAIARKEMDTSLLRKLKQAGFIRIEYGIETGSEKVLKAMGKPFTIKEAEKVLRATHDQDIETCIYLLVGFPNEMDEDFNDTERFLIRNKDYISRIRSINPLYVMAGSPLHKNPEKFGILLPAHEADQRWYSQDNYNTRDLRKNRVLRLKKLARSLGIPADDDAENIDFSECRL
jgi:radical SAM superfamily enzyme YgiQ (UPF0313 family)